MTSKPMNWKLLGLIALIIFSFSFSTKILNGDATPESDLKGIKVAIYNNQNSDVYLASRIALQNMFEWMNAKVFNITALEIQQGKLFEYSIFVIPGRAPGVSLYELGENGMNSILDYIKLGGSYIGICGGAIFAASEEFNLFSGEVLYPVPGVSPTTHITEMRLIKNSGGPNFSSKNETFSTLYWGSSYFNLNGMNNILPIALYSECNESGMIAYSYGLGNVFLSSPHPEFEENNERDGTDIFDNLNDVDSEWPMMLNISQWLVSSSRDRIIIIWTVSLGGGAIIAAFITLLIIRKRKSKISKS
jgi:glutamine amidotransferase-like uncharacterized protein